MIVKGMIWTNEGQIYDCIAIDPYIRRDGVKVDLATLGSCCADCGTPFLSKAALNADESKRLSRRCVSHRKPGKRIGPKLSKRANAAIAKRGE